MALLRFIGTAQHFVRRAVGAVRSVRFYAGLQEFTQITRQFDLRTASTLCCARLYCKIVPDSRQRALTLRLKGVAHPISLRPTTSDWAVVQQILVAEDYNSASQAHEIALSRFYEDVLRESKVPVIVDCGANIGLASVWYAQRFPHARIFAIEPEPENFKILAVNTANYPNITPVQGAVSDRETRVSLSNAGDAPWAWKVSEAGETGEIATFTIPGLLATLSESRLMIVKIDIEGSEVELFRSNLDWTRQTPLIVFESHDWLFAWRGTFHAVLAALIDQPRDYLQKGENTFAFSHDLLRAAGGRGGAAEHPPDIIGAADAPAQTPTAFKSGSAGEIPAPQTVRSSAR